MPSVIEIEEAIIAKLDADITYFKKVGTIADFLQMDADNLAIIAPAAFVTYTGSGYEHRCASTSVADRRMQFTVILVAKNVVSQKKLLHGDANKTGVYKMIDDVRTSLKEQNLGLDIRPLLPVSDHAIDGNRNTAVYGIIFSTLYRV